MSSRSLVIGPAYLDRIVAVDRPLIDPAIGPRWDGSVDGHLRAGSGLSLRDPVGSTLAIEPPDGWPGPFGVIEVSRPLAPTATAFHRSILGTSCRDDLGGMGAGFGSALGGILISALGAPDDPLSSQIGDRLARHGIDSRPIRLDGRSADWTLLISSGPFGDKLAVGFRGCHASIPGLGPIPEGNFDLLVVAGVPNRLAREAFERIPARLRLFAPSIRNMADEPPVSAFDHRIEVLSCNRLEWEALADRDRVAATVPLVAVTDGPSGHRLSRRLPSGKVVFEAFPSFPRDHPPLDTNRAGEAFAATLARTLLDADWPGLGFAYSIARAASIRASAASALVLDRIDFGFPSPIEIDALAAGRVGD